MSLAPKRRQSILGLGLELVLAAGFPVQHSAEDAREGFAALRSKYAPRAYQLAYWIIAAPAPWSGDCEGFPDLDDWPDASEARSLG